MENIENKNDVNPEESKKIDNSNMNNFRKEMFSFLKDLVIIIIIVFIIRTFVVLPFQISWQSMYDSYYDKEFIIVNRFEYLNFPYFWAIREPQRWDVIVFNTHIEDKEYFIKRIIWLPWETLKIQSWSVFIKTIWATDFVELDEKYLMDTNYKATYVRWTEDAYTYEVPEWEYFVMWDNRNASTDSRACFSSCLWSKSNYIKRKDIVWKVFVDLWYFNLRNFSFIQPDLWVDSTPRFFSSPSSYNY